MCLHNRKRKKSDLSPPTDRDILQPLLTVETVVFSEGMAVGQWPVSQGTEAGSQNKNKGCMGIDVAQPPRAFGQGLDRLISRDR